MGYIRVLEKPVGTLTILTHLAKNGETTITLLKGEVGLNQRTAYSALKKLIDLGMIRRETITDFPRTIKRYTLTEDGRQLAEKLEEAEKLLQERLGSRNGIRIAHHPRRRRSWRGKTVAEEE